MGEELKTFFYPVGRWIQGKGLNLFHHEGHEGKSEELQSQRLVSRRGRMVLRFVSAFLRFLHVLHGEQLLTLDTANVQERRTQ